ncbi:hypothetical protein M758_UG062200 [Ceratodon purpureus]|nr:hypothetical protein M758_UG062200 [Ceratodon purpureus]
MNHSNFNGALKEIPMFRGLNLCCQCHHRKRLVPLPTPFGLRYMGTWYLPLTVFCFAAMSNGVNLTDGLDGLARVRQPLRI